MDVGMNDFLCFSLYYVKYVIRVIIFFKGCKILFCDVVGFVCESSDIFLKGVYLLELELGDKLVIEKVGVYGFSMVS